MWFIRNTFNMDILKIIKLVKTTKIIKISHILTEYYFLIFELFTRVNF